MFPDLMNRAFALLCLTSLSALLYTEGSSGINDSSYETVPLESNTETTRDTRHQSTTTILGVIEIGISVSQNSSDLPGHVHDVSSSGQHPIRHHRHHRGGHIHNTTSATNNNNSNTICFTGSSKPCVSEAQLASTLDQFVTEVFDCHQTTTAMTLAVVKDGRVILTKGYGRTKVKGGEPVTARTRFAIGSLTKAFTAAVVVGWLHRNNKTVDTPIQTFYPEFRVTDELRSRMATFRDLLAHRMGIPGHMKPLLVGMPEGLSRAQFVGTMADMPTWLSFRDKFTYNNYMYTAAAHVIEKMSRDKTWEEQVREQLLVPLNMTRTGFFGEHDRKSNNKKNNKHSEDTMKDNLLEENSDTIHIPDFAHACAESNGTVEDVPSKLWVSIVPCGPAGSIYSNAEDMAKWMTFQLSKGQGPSGDAVVDPKVIAETWNPSMLTWNPHAKRMRRPKDPLSHVWFGYGMGWVSAYYNGFHHIYHTGGYLTHSSRLWLFPDANVGIYLTVNGPQTRTRKRNLTKSLMYYIANELLGEPQWFNASTACQGIPEFTQTTKSTKANNTTEKSNSSSPENSNMQINSGFVCSDCPHIKSFVGTYTNKCFGKMYISLASDDPSKNQLTYKFGRFGEATFSRVSELKFEGNYTGPLRIFNNPRGISETLLFSQGKAGRIDGLQYLLEGKDKWTTFKRLSELSDEPLVLTVKARDAGYCLHSDMVRTVLAVCLAVLCTL